MVRNLLTSVNFKRFNHLLQVNSTCIITTYFLDTRRITWCIWVVFLVCNPSAYASSSLMNWHMSVTASRSVERRDRRETLTTVSEPSPALFCFNSDNKQSVSWSNLKMEKYMNGSTRRRLSTSNLVLRVITSNSLTFPGSCVNRTGISTSVSSVWQLRLVCEEADASSFVLFTFILMATVFRFLCYIFDCFFWSKVMKNILVMWYHNSRAMIHQEENFKGIWQCSS